MYQPIEELSSLVTRLCLDSLDRGQYVLVAPASADVAIEVVGYFFGRGIGRLSEEGGGRHQEPRRAKPALHRTLENERTLQIRDGRSLGKALYGFYGPVYRFRSERRARADRISIDKDCACAADLDVTRPLGACEP